MSDIILVRSNGRKFLSSAVYFNVPRKYSQEKSIDICDDKGVYYKNGTQRYERELPKCEKYADDHVQHTVKDGKVEILYGRYCPGSRVAGMTLKGDMPHIASKNIFPLLSLSLKSVDIGIVGRSHLSIASSLLNSRNPDYKYEAIIVDCLTIDSVAGFTAKDLLLGHSGLMSYPPVVRSTPKGKKAKRRAARRNADKMFEIDSSSDVSPHVSLIEWYSWLPDVLVYYNVFLYSKDGSPLGGITKILYTNFEFYGDKNLWDPNLFESIFYISPK